MKDFKALVLAHYNFTNKNGKEINTTKCRVSMGEYGYFDICTDLANEKALFSEIKVELLYDNKKNKLIISKIV